MYYTAECAADEMQDSPQHLHCLKYSVQVAGTRPCKRGPYDELADNDTHVLHVKHTDYFVYFDSF